MTADAGNALNLAPEAPAPEVNTPATQETNNAPAPAANEQPAAGGETDAGQAHKKEPWFQRRIDQLTAEKWEERRKAEALTKQTEDLLAQLAEHRKAPAARVQETPAPENALTAPPQTPPPPQVSEAEITARAQKMAIEMAKRAEFDKKCNDVYAAGKNEFSDFDQTLKTFQMFDGIPPAMLDVVIKRPNGHKLLYTLGKDAELAERLVKLPPTDMAFELATLEQGLDRPQVKQVSNAPRPVTPIDGGSRVSDDPDTMDTEAWMAWRAKQLEGRRR